MSGPQTSQSLPRGSVYLQKSDCAVCGLRAKLIYSCKKCGEERKYCASFVCQSEDWDSHQVKCQVETGASEVLEDTLIKHVSGGLTWSRSRKISISASDIMDAVRSEEALSKSEINSSHESLASPVEHTHHALVKSNSTPAGLRPVSDSSDDGSDNDDLAPSPRKKLGLYSPTKVLENLNEQEEVEAEAEAEEEDPRPAQLGSLAHESSSQASLSNAAPGEPPKPAKGKSRTLVNSIRLKLSKGGPEKDKEAGANESSTLESPVVLFPGEGEDAGKVRARKARPGHHKVLKDVSQEMKRSRSASVAGGLNQKPPAAQLPAPLGYKEGVLFAHFPAVSTLALSKVSSANNSGTFAPPSPTLPTFAPIVPPSPTTATCQLDQAELQQLASKVWLVLDEFFLYGYESRLATDTPLHQIKLHGCRVVRDKVRPDCFWLEKRGFPLVYLLPDGKEGLNEHLEWYRVLTELCEFYNAPERSMKNANSSSSLLSKASIEGGLFTMELQKLTETYEEKLRESLSNDFVSAPASELRVETKPAEETPQTTPEPSLLELRRAMLDAQKNRQTVLMKQDSQTRMKLENRVRAGTIVGQALSPTESEMYKAGLSLKDEGDTDAQPVMVHERQLVLSYHLTESGSVDRYTVTAGTLDLLVERLADEDHPDTNYIDTFLLGYRYLLSATTLIEKLVTRFNVVPPPNPSAEQMAYYNKYANVIKVRVLGVIKKWIDGYWTDFENTEAAYNKLTQFIAQLMKDKDVSISNLAVRLESIIKDKQRQEKFIRTVAEATQPEKTRSRKRPVEFTILDAKEFAHQLTLVDHEKFAVIQPYEFVIRLWEGAGPQTRNLTQMITWSNRISYFTATEICIQPDLKKRARLLESFIKVAKECRRVQNYNSLMAILSGLNNSSVRRLKKTWNLVQPKALKDLQALEDLMNGAHNFGRYREILAQIEREEDSGPCIPFLALVLRDLTFLNDGNPKKFKSGLYNFTKLRRISETVFTLVPFQNEPYAFRSSRFSVSVQDYLRAPYCITDDNTLYNCSLLCEPRSVGDGQTLRLLEKWSKDASKTQKSVSKSMIVSGIHSERLPDSKE